MTPARQREEQIQAIVYEDEDPSDVHAASTTVAELPNELLESLKSPAFRSTTTMAPPPPEPAPSLPAISDGDLAIVDLTSLLDADEPETLQLETVLLGVPPPAPEPPAGPVEIQVEIPTPIRGPLEVVQGEIAELPRSWKIAGTFVAMLVVTTASVTLLSLVLD